MGDPAGAPHSGALMLPEPLVPVDTDVRGFPCMLLGCQQVLDSDFNAIANDAEFRAGVTLWLKAWHQVPAGSLPNDERVLAYNGRASPSMHFTGSCCAAITGFTTRSSAKKHSKCWLIASSAQRRQKMPLLNAGKIREKRIMLGQCLSNTEAVHKHCMSNPQAMRT